MNIGGLAGLLIVLGVILLLLGLFGVLASTTIGIVVLIVGVVLYFLPNLRQGG